MGGDVEQGADGEGFDFDGLFVFELLFERFLDVVADGIRGQHEEECGEESKDEDGR